MDPFQRAPDRPAEVHGAQHQEAGEGSARPQEGGVTSNTGPYPADTIVAIATPPGAGAIGVIRVSGARAV
ncbi:MAG: hypothetical protein DMD86_14030, partial [Candidatus Rokuibacteriota bacterium]